MLRRMKTRRFLALVLLVLLAIATAAVVAGCGGSDDETTQSSDADDGGKGTDKPVKLHGDPPGPPEAKQSIDNAKKRIEEAIDSGDCDKINSLNPVASELDTPERCEALQTRFEGAESTGSEAYAGGAVIDYVRDDLTQTAVMILDQDGRFHVAYVDAFLGEESAGTRFDPKFDAAAQDSVDALAARDCDKFLEVANRRVGPGAADRDATCAYAEENNPIADVLDAAPDTKLESLGGNANYAFYGLDGPGVYYTIIMARQTDESQVEAAAPLPEDAAPLGFVTAYATNTQSPDK